MEYSIGAKKRKYDLETTYSSTAAKSPRAGEKAASASLDLAQQRTRDSELISREIKSTSKLRCPSYGMYYLRLRSKEACKLLDQTGSYYVKAHDPKTGDTLLHMAVQSDAYSYHPQRVEELVKQLIDNECDVTLVSNRNETPLAIASRMNRVEIIKLLQNANDKNELE